MAQGGTNWLEIALLAGAAYVAWEWFTSSSTVTTPPPTNTPPPCPAPGVLANNVCTCPAPNTLVSGVCTAPAVYVPPSLVDQLQTLAGSGVTMLNADQWNYYLTSASPLGLAQAGNPNFTSIFFPSGRPPAGTAEPTMTAQQFVNAMGLSGLSGLGQTGWKRVIPVPQMFARNRGFGSYQRFTLGDLRRAGGR